MKKTLLVLLAVMLTLGVVCNPAYAFKGGDHEARGERVERFQKRQSQKNMFLKNVKLIYRFQEELGVTEEQLATLKDIKNTASKESIMKKAEISVISVDIKAALQEEEVDVAAVNALIDKKYEIKKAEEKAKIGAVAQLKKVLTDEQKDKLKTLIKEHKPERRSRHDRQGRPEGCPMKEGLKEG